MLFNYQNVAIPFWNGWCQLTHFYVVQCSAAASVLRSNLLQFTVAVVGPPAISGMVRWYSTDNQHTLNLKLQNENLTMVCKFSDIAKGPTGESHPRAR
jgi:hypothetical protein